MAGQVCLEEAGGFMRSGSIKPITIQASTTSTTVIGMAPTRTGPNFNGGSRMTHNQWWHIVAWNENTSATWINGVKSYPVTGGLNNKSSTLWLGGNPDSGETT